MEEALLPHTEERTRASTTFVEELTKVTYIAAPMVVVTVSLHLLQVVSLMMAGHLGELSLSGVSIGGSFAGVTGFSLLASLLFSILLLVYAPKRYKPSL
jgi:MATE family multidrug resistance protein